MQRCGSNTLAVQGGVLQDIVETHLTPAVTRDFRDRETVKNFRRNIRSYAKLVTLLDKRDGDGAERHWCTHMEAVGKRLLGEDPQNRPVVELFA